MNTKRILMSSAIVIAVAAVTIGGTGAFFSDTETSTGNVFTAGAVDLQVDHQSASYNGEDCTTTCDPWAVEVESFTQGDRRDGSDVLAERSDPTLALGPAQTTGVQNDSSPTGFVSLGFGGEIVLKFPNGIDDGPGDDIRIYEATGGSNYPVESLLVEVSGDGVDWTTITVSPNEIEYDGTVEIDLNGVQTARFVRLTDTSDPADFPTRPEADGYDLDAVEAIHCDDAETDGVASDIWQCQLWEATDLTTETFFNFSDVKPQDSGMNVISLHVDNNDAYACLNVVNKEDNENGINRPESEAGDNSDPAGELGANLMVAGFYSDSNGNEGAELFPATAVADLDTITYADSTTGTPIAGDSTEYIKLNWCLGEFNSDGSCNGDVPDINQTQTDSFLADLQFSVVQTRNNENFVCESSDDDEDDDTAPAFATSTGTGFPTEGSLTFTGEGRIGNSAGTATGAGGDQELKLGTNINNSSASVVAQFDMGSDSTRDFTLSYASSTQIATLVLTNGTDTETLTYNVGTVTPGSALYFIGKNNQSGGPLTELTNLQLNGQSVGGTLSLDGTGSADIEFIKVAGSDLSEGFVATGTVLLDGNSSFAAQLFQVQVRN